jgi:hypothetical protein
MERILQRLDVMERSLNKHTERLDHLDDCIDRVKTTVSENKAAVEKWQAIWDRRWVKMTIAIAFCAGLVFAAGSGTVSLKAALEVLEKIVK